MLDEFLYHITICCSFLFEVNCPSSIAIEYLWIHFIEALFLILSKADAEEIRVTHCHHQYRGQLNNLSSYARHCLIRFPWDQLRQSSWCKYEKRFVSLGPLALTAPTFNSSPQSCQRQLSHTFLVRQTQLSVY